jgi:3-phosphoshikimate 1-carboxyvinyltransferase
VKLRIRPSGPLSGSMPIPGDKSIAHRTLLLGSIAEGDSRIDNFPAAEVCLTTLRLIRALGVVADDTDRGALTVHGRGLHGLCEPENVLDCSGSGTTIRLLSGLLAGQPFASIVTGSPRLRSRPMARIVEPLRRMGATVLGRANGAYAPLAIQGGGLRGMHHALPVASAQVKSCLLLAGLYAAGETVVHEPGPSRDHTERMLQAMGVVLFQDEAGIHVRGSPLRPVNTRIPGDMSSAAFGIMAASLVPGSRVTMEAVGINPTRAGLLDVLQSAGINCSVRELPASGGEPVGDLAIEAATLSAMQVDAALVPRMIDELPILAIAATQAHGRTVVADAAELRVKESDRVANLVLELRKMGAHIEERPDGFVVTGPTHLQGTVLHSHHDHRLAMALGIAGLVAEGETLVEGAECICDSFPDFAQSLRAIGADCEEL